MGMSFEKKYPVNFYNIDSKFRCKVTSFFDFLGDVGMSQSEELGVGIHNLLAKNLTWVFYKYNFKIFRYPEFGEEIRIVFMREITYGHMVKTMCSVQEQESGKIKVIHLIKDDEGSDITALTTIWKADKASL